MMSTFLISNSYSVQLFLFCTARLFTGATCLQTCGTSSRTMRVGKTLDTREGQNQIHGFCIILSCVRVCWHHVDGTSSVVVGSSPHVTSFSCRGITPRRGHARLLQCHASLPLLGFTHALCVRAIRVCSRN